jgi:hypothetical protein
MGDHAAGRFDQVGAAARHLEVHPDILGMNPAGLLEQRLHRIVAGLLAALRACARPPRRG